MPNNGEQVTIDAVREVLGTGSPYIIHKHLAQWRAGQAEPAEAPKVEIPEALAAVPGAWAQQFAHDSGAGVREALE
ncbi:DNA-binding protein [Massilia sp. GCM10020059]|uniref:DNA-binding protein n=1 Tax=Massilia agrisoli TaxID=2892444 RepID=A0ABS8INZ0_9BURK|nr:DNA-binding protein [Massilia agrisoli]MCC6070327.1 DNA-binding protein [Massilia agrisoli]